MGTDLEKLYEAVEDATRELVNDQPWWPCLSCPVAKTEDNCCHKAMFHVSDTEWEYLREHPFIQEHREELVLAARQTVKSLRSQGWDTSDWTSTIAHFANDGCFTCPLFNNATGLCNVYERRPLICRTYGLAYRAESDEIFGCPIVVGEVHANGGKEIQFIPMDDITSYASTILHKPSKPIVAWLAGEKL